MKRYQHRVNSIEHLARLPAEMGLECDLRSDGSRVIVTHDPDTDGPSIEEFFPRIGARPCIFNIKCEGIEARVLEQASGHGIEDFFLLDCSVPAAVRLVSAGEHRIAVRYSEWEPVEGVMVWAGKAQFVWVDCFTTFPDDIQAWGKIAAHFQVCLVSPELQGHGIESIARFRVALSDRVYHAVCTKRPDLWQSTP